MGNRKQPFGYKLELGVVVVEPSEAKLVQWLYDRYSLGDPYSALVRSLKEQPVSYLPGKLWNKNMVARILEDERYLGTQDYPAIIKKEAAETVDRKRQEKQDPKTYKTETQKLLRQLSGCKITEQMERSVLDLMNTLVADPEQIVVQPQKINCTRIRELERELESLLEQLPVDKAEAKRLTMELAAERYATISDSGYETERLKRLLGKKKLMDTLDVELLKNTVAKIDIRGDGTIWLQLQNGQTFEEGADHGNEKRKNGHHHSSKS